MQLVSDAVLKDRYDVIVVGAGLGGMTAASLLAKRGLSVLMIEQQDRPGGSCTSFRRKGITYDVGTAMLYGFGDQGFKPFRLLINELEEPVEMVAHSTLARMTFEGQPITFWPEIERFLQELDRLYPGEKEGLRAFYRDLYRMYENIVLKNEVVVPPSEFSPVQGLRSLMSGPVQLLRMQKLLSTSVRSLMDRYFKGPEIINFFDKLCSAYCYCTADETPAVMAATMFIDNHVGGVYYPAGGAQMLPNKIEKAFERYGGQTLYQTLVDEILIKDNRAYGVRLKNGVEIYAERVVANVTVWNLYGKLVRPEHIRPERLAWAHGLVPTFPSMTLYMLVDRSALPEDVLPWEVFIENRAVIDSSDLTLYVNSLVDETLGPPGKMVITAIAPNLSGWPAPESAEYHGEAYRQHKQAEAQHMLDQIEQHFPGFCSKIETLIVGTPTTIERYLLKNGGAVGGPKNMIGQEMLKRLHARSEWQNLYICGDSTVMGTGAPATVVSGVGAANMVLRDMRRKGYDRRKYSRSYIEFVKTPYTRAAFGADDPVNAQTAWLAAAACQGCQEPACVRDCPASIDIPAIMRRMEAGNLPGAARELRQHSPFASLCGTACPAAELCERHCYRKSFTGKAVRIAEVLRWVNQAAGKEGWLPREGRLNREVVVLGGTLAGMTCAYYLRLAGCSVTVFDKHADQSAALDMTGEDRHAIAAAGVNFYGVMPAVRVEHHEWLWDQDAVYFAGPEWLAVAAEFDGQQRTCTAQIPARALTPAEAVAEGRRAAFAIYAVLKQQKTYTTREAAGR